MPLTEMWLTDSSDIDSSPGIRRGTTHEYTTRDSTMGSLPLLWKQDPNQSTQRHGGSQLPTILPQMQNRNPGRYYATENDCKQMS